MKNNRKFSAFLAGVFFCLATLALADETPTLYQKIDYPDLRFIVIGDWGNYGNSHQQAVAKQMNTLAGRARVDFIVSTGDNIYDKGVTSATDPLWKQSFEDIYQLPNIESLDWYITLGNHDYRGNHHAQIDYGKRNPRWLLPSNYFSLELEYQKGRATLLLTDTNIFKSHYRKNADEYKGVDSYNPQAQLSWMNAQLEKTDNSVWKIVVGHHPMYATGTRGNDKELIAAYENIFRDHSVHAYFAGHDHTLQHQKPSGNTHYFVSGAGAKLRVTKASKPHTRFAESKRGFAYVAIAGDSMQVEFIDERGETLHAVEVPL